MKALKYALLSTALAVAMSGMLVWNARAAQSASADGSTRGKWRERVKEELNLTDNQVAQIKAQLQSERGILLVVMKRMHEAQAGLRAEIQRPGATDASVRAAAARVSAVESDLAVERLRLYEKISPILTPDQRAKLAHMQEGIDELVGHALERAGSKHSDK